MNTLVARLNRRFEERHGYRLMAPEHVWSLFVAFLLFQSFSTHWLFGSFVLLGMSITTFHITVVKGYREVIEREAGMKVDIYDRMVETIGSDSRARLPFWSFIASVAWFAAMGVFVISMNLAG